MLVGVGVLFFVLLGWVAAVDGPVRRLDERVGRAVRGRAEGFAQVLADLGEVAVAVPVLVAVLLYVGWRERAGRWWVAPGVGVLVMAAVPLVVVPVKALVGRGGPPGMAGTGFYPSGHAATAAVAYGVAVALLLPYLRGVWVRRVLVVGCVVVVGAAGVGLVWCGYHWPLDVVGSWVLGGVLVGSVSMRR
ncbi:phosphatase PAP2 family protein [Streptomyces sp. E11-3]|uniref:phosphatase PAP2 family protein n=1 Tax=Streptomyces sp. E11-3 TaxID=3110112 RepID=UPI0039811453